MNVYKFFNLTVLKKIFIIVSLAFHSFIIQMIGFILAKIKILECFLKGDTVSL